MRNHVAWHGRVPADSAAKTPETGVDSQCKTSLPSTLSPIGISRSASLSQLPRFSSPGRCSCALRKVLDLIRHAMPCQTAGLGPKRLQEANYQTHPVAWHIPSLEPGFPGDFLVAIMRCPYYSRGPDPEDSDFQCRKKNKPDSR